jgi:glutaredoxin
MSKNMVELDRPQMTIWRVHFAYQTIKVTDRHLEYVILIAFPRQCHGVRTLPVLFYSGHSIDVCTRFESVLQTSYTDSLQVPEAIR